MSISEIPSGELLADLEETLQDIELCTFALAQGIPQYGTNKSVEYRLNTNRMIRDQIQAELARRDAAYVAA